MTITALRSDSTDIAARVGIRPLNRPFLEKGLKNGLKKGLKQKSFRIIIPLSEAATVSAGYAEEKKQTVAANGTIIRLSQIEIIKIVNFCSEPKSRDEIMGFLGQSSPEYFRRTILKPLTDAGYLIMTEPPRSSKQKYIGFNQKTSN